MAINKATPKALKASGFMPSGTGITIKIKRTMIPDQKPMVLEFFILNSNVYRKQSYKDIFI